MLGFSPKTDIGLFKEMFGAPLYRINNVNITIEVARDMVQTFTGQLLSQKCCVINAYA